MSDPEPGFYFRSKSENTRVKKCEFDRSRIYNTNSNLIARKRACAIPVHDYSKVLLRPVSDESMKIYQKYIQVSLTKKSSLKRKSAKLGI